MLDMTRFRVCVTCLAYLCDMRYLYVQNYSFVCVIWLIYMCGMTSHMCNMTCTQMCATCHQNWPPNTQLLAMSFIHVPWLIHMCAMTSSYECHDSLCVLNDSLKDYPAARNVINERAMTHSKCTITHETHTVWRTHTHTHTRTPHDAHTHIHTHTQRGQARLSTVWHDRLSLSLFLSRH